MSTGLRVRHAAAARETVVVRVWRWIKITVWRVFYGQNEWQRLFQSPAEADEDERIVRFRTELALSDTMAQTCDVVFATKPFPMDETLRDVATRAQLDEKDVTLMANVRSCLRRCNYVNKVYARVCAEKNEGYTSSNEVHEAMLEQLWRNLKPNVRRKGGRITKEWGEIGFQGTDPMSDFRGMGIFSLVQLNYFTKNYKVEAQRALEESNHPTRWYPFAVTGINVTAFLIELIDERLLDVKLYRLAANGKDDEDLNAGLMQLHDVYATIFTRFNKLWVDTNPRDVMAFPCLFQSLKDVIRAELMLASFRF
uniref:ELMO domain-containing protein n=1 Tax=Peronospora matthiolae TaxID=2874970 RepID=A0AAV1T525_9STRA